MIPTWAEIGQAAHGHIDPTLNATLRGSLSIFLPVPERRETGDASGSDGGRAPASGNDDDGDDFGIPLVDMQTEHVPDGADIVDGGVPLKREKRGLQSPPPLPPGPDVSVPEEAFKQFQQMLHADFPDTEDDVCSCRCGCMYAIVCMLFFPCSVSRWHCDVTLLRAWTDCAPM